MKTRVSLSVGMIHLGAVVLLAGAVGGCGGGDTGPVPITETRDVGLPVDVPTNDLTAAERLLPPAHVHDHAEGMPADEAAADASLTWTTPEGWTQGAARSMRVATFTSGAGGAVECYIAELSGMGGGTEANFNRWRGQLEQPPLAAGEFDALPRIRVLGQDAPLVEVDGTYRGMGDTEQAGSKLLGTLASDGGRTFFVKMVGPAAEVDAQRAAFLALCESLKTAAE
ncbi:MAG: hypothetical protein K8T26_19980 [Lentisphaerae bacterium]|nr:hypothetical protein [Lentisphaerota bacterium]